MTVLLHTARISTVEVIISSDMWVKMVNFVLGNRCERWVNLHDAWWCLHVYMHETRLSIYTLTWYKILWLFLHLVKIWFLTVATLKQSFSFLVLFRTRLAKWCFTVYTSTLLQKCYWADMNISKSTMHSYCASCKCRILY